MSLLYFLYLLQSHFNISEHVLLKFHVDYVLEKDDEGKEHMVPNKYSYDFDVKENANFNLTNLFNGNKELSE